MGGRMIHLSIDPNIGYKGMDAYDLLVAVVAPRPIAFVSTVSLLGKPNLAPFSFFNAGGANPPSVIFSPCTKADGSDKDTLRNIRETGEYVINLVSYEMRDGMMQASLPLAYGESEWPRSGFTPVPSALIRPARVAEAPFSLECRLHQIVPHGSGPDAANYVIGEVVQFHIDQDLIVDGKIRPQLVRQLSRLGDSWFATTCAENLFEMQRPRIQ
jgi:flavin reductase (DIM6/NTAB) family NADH-FMN oxidoreductase RutF